MAHMGRLVHAGALPYYMVSDTYRGSLCCGTGLGIDSDDHDDVLAGEHSVIDSDDYAEDLAGCIIVYSSLAFSFSWANPRLSGCWVIASPSLEQHVCQAFGRRPPGGGSAMEFCA